MKNKINVPNVFGKKKEKGSSGSGSGSNFPLGTIILILLIAFVLLGGISQRKFIETTLELTQNLGKAFSGLFTPDNIEVNDDGVYIKP